MWSNVICRPIGPTRREERALPRVIHFEIHADDSESHARAAEVSCRNQVDPLLPARVTRVSTAPAILCP